MLKRFVKYYKPHWKMFLVDMICAASLSVCDLFYPMLTRQMLNDFIPNGKLKSLVVFAVALLAIYLVKAVLKFITQYFGHVVGVHIQQDMRRDAFDHLEKLPVSYYDNNKTGIIMSKVVNDLFDISELAHHGPEDSILAILLLIASFILMGSINIWLTLIIFFFLPFLIWFAANKRLKLSRTSKKTRAETAEINATLENQISGIRLSKSFAFEEEANAQFEANNERFVEASRQRYKAMGEFFAGNNLIIDVLNVVVFIAGGIFTYKQWITPADFAAFIIFVNIFLTPIKNLINFIEQLQNGMTGFSRFCELMDTPIEQDKPGAKDIDTIAGNVSFNNVTFRYEGTEIDVLKNISFSINPGEKVALVGPSGGGKTTICNLIPRFYNVENGTIEIDGQDINDLTMKSIRSNIGIVNQDVFLFTGSIKENIAFGTNNPTMDEIIEAAKMASIHDFIMKLPNQYDTFVGERGVKLSGGQKQRIAIARVFLKNPPMLILDEATSALDNATEKMIQESLDRLCEGRTTIVVAHRLSTIKNANRIIVITDGGIGEIGTHQELLEKDGLYSELYKSQFAN